MEFEILLYSNLGIQEIKCIISLSNDSILFDVTSTLLENESQEWSGTFAAPNVQRLFSEPTNGALSVERPQATSGAAVTHSGLLPVLNS